MIEVSLTDRLEQMVEKYASQPDLFLGGINEDRLLQLVDQLIEIDPTRRNGKAVIKGTRIAVCDIIADTCELSNSPNFFKTQYHPALDPIAIDAAYSYLLLHPEDLKNDYEACFNLEFPKVLYPE